MSEIFGKELYEIVRNDLSKMTEERDSLKAELAEAHVDCIRLQQEINCLRMEPCQLPHCVKDRDAWREMAEKLYRAGDLLSRAYALKDSDEINTVEDRFLKTLNAFTQLQEESR